ncbi:MAG TPA: chemotaxis protein CheW [Dongiaceae bacterium]|jgi:purine-binding chemotaxis protein CheW
MTPSQDKRSIEVLTLTLQGELFALEAGRVQEILDQVPVTEVPGGSAFVSGLVNVRGKVVPLADLRLKFDMTPTSPTIDTRIVVIDVLVDGEMINVGLLADKVHEVTELQAEVLEDTPRIGMRWRPELIRCIGKRGSDFIVVLDIDRVFEEGDQGTPVENPISVPAQDAA